MAWLSVVIGRLREDRVTAATLFGLVLVSAFLLASAPGVLTRVADDALRVQVASVPQSVSAIQLVEERRVDAAPEQPLANLDAVGASNGAKMPDGVRALISRRAAVADTALWSVTSGASTATSVRLRFEAGAEERVRYVDGRPPTSTTERVAPPIPEPGRAEVPSFEGALSRASAEALGLATGATLYLAPDPSDSLAAGHPDRLVIHIVGTFDVPDQADPFWFDDLSLAKPARRALSNEIVFLTAVILMPPSVYPAFMDATESSELPVRYTWWYGIAPERLHAADVGAVAGELRRMESIFSTTPARFGPAEGTLLRSGLLRVIETHAQRWRSAENVLLVVGVGPAAIGVATIAFVALFAARRRRAALETWRGRGATTTQLLLGTLAESLFVAAPAAVAGTALAVALTGGPLVPSVLAGLAVCAVAIFLAITAALRPARAAPVAGEPDAARSQPPSPRRLVLEAALGILAVTGVYLLAQRGIRGSSATGAISGPDPFLAAAPALAAVALAVIAARVVPAPVRFLARAAASRRDLVPVLALRRATREGTVAPALAVLLAMATIGAFSSATLVYVDRSIEAIAWQDVGAPFRISAGGAPLPPRVRVDALPRAEAVARAYRKAVALNDGTRFELLALDMAGYQAVARGLPTAEAPSAIDAAAGPPYPAIVSTSLASASDGIAIGKTFKLTVDRDVAEFRAAGTLDAFPLLPASGRFVIVSRDQLDAADPSPLQTTDLLVRAPDDSGPALRAAVATEPGLTVESRLEEAAALRASPVVAAVSIGIALLVGIAAAYATLAFAAAIALASAARRIESAQLRTFGLTPRDSVRLLLAEHGPVVALAFAAGTTAGLTLFAVLRDALGVRALLGSGARVSWQVDLAHVAVLAVVLVVVTSAALGLGVALERGATLASALRRPAE